MTKALYPASFDPITFGHVDIAERAAKIFKSLVVAVFDKPLKNLLFDIDERYNMAAKAVAHIPNVEVVRYNGLTAKFAQNIGVDVMVRGLRVISDFEWEMQLALANQSIAPDVETICLMASHQFSFVSSSLVREIAMNGGTVTHLAPPHVVDALTEKYEHHQKHKLS